MSNETDTNAAAVDAPATPGRPRRTPADRAEAERLDAEEKARKALAVKQAQPEGPHTLVVKHGTYVGPGCPNPEKRVGSFVIEHKLGGGRIGEEVVEYDHSGFGYDHKHPAQPGERVKGLSRKRAAEMLRSGTFETEAQYDARQERKKIIDVDALLGPEHDEPQRKPMRVRTTD